MRFCHCGLLAVSIGLFSLLAGCGGDGGPASPDRDLTPPAAVVDLTAVAADDSTVTLVFTAPGDDGATGRAAEYELRSAVFPANPDDWAGWSRIGREPAPRPGGAPDTIRAAGLSAGLVYVFRLRAADEAANWSPPSNAVVATADPLLDTTPPADVTDLQVQVDAYGRILLSWTAPGDDGALGSIDSYDIRRAGSPLTAQSWPQAAPLSFAAFPPGSPGTREQIRARGLDLATQYWFALVAVDEHGNSSELSNVASITTPAHRTWYVTVDGTGDAPTIRSACVDSARNGDVVLVAPGRYTWSNQGDGVPSWGMLFFPRNDEQGVFTLCSEAGPEQTIIDAEDQDRVFMLQGFGDYHLGITIEGFTITGGNGWTVGSTDSVGGGLTYHLNSPFIRNCIFRGNRARFGGAIAQAGWGEPVVENCLFEQNEAEYGGAIGLFNSEPSATFTDCTFRDNTAREVGGAVYAANATFRCERCLVYRNHARDKGGGFYCGDVHPSSIVECSIVENSVGLGGIAGGIRVYHYASDRSLRLENTIVAFSQGGGGIRFGRETGSTGTIEIGCCDVYGNTGTGGDTLPLETTDLGGNFSQDPLFCGAPGSGDYGLQAASPCAPGQHPSGAACGPIGAQGIGCGGIRGAPSLKPRR